MIAPAKASGHTYLKSKDPRRVALRARRLASRLAERQDMRRRAAAVRSNGPAQVPHRSATVIFSDGLWSAIWRGDGETRSLVDDYPTISAAKRAVDRHLDAAR